MTRKYLVPPVFTPSYGRKWWHCWPGCVHKLSTHLEFSVSAGEMPSSRCAMLFLFRIRTCVQLVGVQQKSNAPWWWLFVIRHLILIFFFTAVSNPHKKSDNQNQKSSTDKGCYNRMLTSIFIFLFHDFTSKRCVTMREPEHNALQLADGIFNRFSL